ncbi:esterase/lipase family protein, partial [Neisseria sp. P0009.S007]
MAKIILLHGLHMHSWVMKPLAYLLEQEGFEVALFDYYSVLHSMNRHVEDLARWIDEN